MAGSQAGDFIEEEEFGITIRCHYRSLSSSEFQQAKQPPLHLPGPPNAARFVVEHPPVAHEGASLRSGDDFAEGSDPILPRHHFNLPSASPCSPSPPIR